MKWPRRKIDSYRRWKRRWELGKVIPYVAVMEHPRLRILTTYQNCKYLPHMDAFRMKYFFE